MEDILISLTIILVVAIVVAGVFIYTTYARRQKSATLKLFCQSRGWFMESENSPLASADIITSPNWRLESTSRSVQGEEAPGSTGWTYETVWKSTTTGSIYPSLVLGTKMSSLDINNVPSFMRPAVENAMRAEFGLGLDDLQSGILNERLAGKFLLFADDRSAARDFVQKIQPPLESWPSRIRFRLQTAPSGIEIRCTGLRIKTQSELEPIVALGEACLSL